jgi:hypothetical protein
MVLLTKYYWTDGIDYGGACSMHETALVVRRRCRWGGEMVIHMFG